MADDTAKLIAIVEANTKQFENALKRIEKTVDKTFRGGAASAARLERGIASTAAKTDHLSRSMTRARASIRSFTTALGTPFSAIGVALATKQVVDYADAWTSAGNKLAAASEIAGRQARSLKEINDIATETRTGLTATVDLYSKLLRATKDVASSEREVAQATELVNKAFKAGGAAASEQAAGILQLAQGLSSGVLQGDELRSIRENAPVLAEAIAKEFETTIGGLKALGAEGELTAARIFKAILKGGPEIEKAFGRTESTIGEAMTLLGNAMMEAVGDLDDLTGSSQKLVKALGSVVDQVEKIGEKAEWTLDKLEKLRQIMVALGMLGPNDALPSTNPIGTIRGALDKFDRHQDIENRKAEIRIVEELLNLEKERAVVMDQLQGKNFDIDAMQGQIAAGQSGVIEKLQIARDEAEILRQKFNDINAETLKLRENLSNLPRYDPLSSFAIPGGLLTREQQTANSLAQRYGAPTTRQPPMTTNKTAQLIAGYEDFRPSAYWDVNHSRVGYGSDTMTDAMGQIHTVTAESVTTIADATRDLLRRISEIQADIIREVGPQAWGALTEEAQAAITSMVYNYGSLQKTGLGPSIMAGDPLAIAAQIERKSTDNGGVNRERRLTEASMVLGRGGGTYDTIIQQEKAAAEAAAEVHREAAEALTQQREELAAILTDREESLAFAQLEVDYAGQSAAALEEQRIYLEEINKLKAAGVDLTSQEGIAQVEAARQYAAGLAGVHATQEAQIEAIRAADEAAEDATQSAIDRADAIRDLSSDVLGGLASDLANGVKPAEALANALQKVAEKLLDIGINALTSSLFGPQGTPLGGLLFGGGATASSQALSAISSGAGGLFAQGGIMTSHGPVSLKRYGSGGVAHGPQMALFGEGRTPEAFVPLPDGRSIPVRLKVPGLIGGGRGSGQQRVVLDSLMKIEPSPLFDIKMESRARQAEDRAVTRAPEHMADQKRRVGQRRG